MNTKITMFDYNFDWALRDYNIHPRSTPGTLSREEVVGFCGTLGIDGIEIRHDYWSDCSPSSIRQICGDAGLPIVTYLFDADLALPNVERQSQMDRVFSLIDRTAELGAKRAFFVPALFKSQWTLEEQRGWLIEALRECAERLTLRV
jgi:sugar phosphate isomerase/epimerase